jgi:hypothetical protein
MVMKFKVTGITAISMAIIIILTACATKVNKGDDGSIVKGTLYDKVIQQGLQNQGLSEQDILYEKIIGESKMIFFTSHNALGIAYMGKDKDGWTYSRITNLYAFESSSNPPSQYMAGGTDFETPNGIKYFLAMGKIFNPNITKVTLSNDMVNAIIKERDGNIFWFQLIENKDSNENARNLNDIKVYDKDNKQLN